MIMSMLAKTGSVMGKAFGGLSVQGILIRLGSEVILSAAANMIDKKISKAIENTATKRK